MWVFTTSKTIQGLHIDHIFVDLHVILYTKIIYNLKRETNKCKQKNPSFGPPVDTRRSESVQWSHDGSMGKNCWLVAGKLGLIFDGWKNQTNNVGLRNRLPREVVIIDLIFSGSILLLYIY